MTGQTVRLTASGRTDAGVHALGQVANFICATRLTARQFHKGLNSILPADIAIRQCQQVPLGFHARYDVISKVYLYQIANRTVRPAIGRQYCWWVRRPLDLEAMDKALQFFVGRHDFKAFEASGSPRAHSKRNILRANIELNSSGLIQIFVEADGFLRYMVRNIVGALVEVGLGCMEPQRIRHLLAARNRCLAPPTAPAQGLCLLSVKYPFTRQSNPLRLLLDTDSFI